MPNLLGMFGFTGLFIPIRAVIRDPKIIFLNNIVRISTVIFSIAVFILYLQGYAVPAEAIITPNAWMDNPSLSTPELMSIPMYCDNKTYDYWYDENWTYLNTTCAPRVRKFLAYFIGYYFILLNDL